mmetsp:Transcript_640/g.934  ORF Transcript_640/g.934 Transcript_640/m.934 type:complete len:266 (+) Transcript_640:819-1616(+)
MVLAEIATIRATSVLNDNIFRHQQLPSSPTIVVSATRHHGSNVAPTTLVFLCQRQQAMIFVFGPRQTTNARMQNVHVSLTTLNIGATRYVTCNEHPMTDAVRSSGNFQLHVFVRLPLRAANRRIFALAPTQQTLAAGATFELERNALPIGAILVDGRVQLGVVGVAPVLALHVRLQVTLVATKTEPRRTSCAELVRHGRPIAAAVALGQAQQLGVLLLGELAHHQQRRLIVLPLHATLVRRASWHPQSSYFIPINSCHIQFQFCI